MKLRTRRWGPHARWLCRTLTDNVYRGAGRARSGAAKEGGAGVGAGARPSKVEKLPASVLHRTDPGAGFSGAGRARGSIGRILRDGKLGQGSKTSSDEAVIDIGSLDSSEQLRESFRAVKIYDGDYNEVTNEQPIESTLASQLKEGGQIVQEYKSPSARDYPFDKSWLNRQKLKESFKGRLWSFYSRYGIDMKIKAPKFTITEGPRLTYRAEVSVGILRAKSLYFSSVSRAEDDAARLLLLKIHEIRNKS
mmetsp:Transcript_6054/g.18261  ORF Transcript_6054/g.18261 Transcript_6054/m.18261 type:complete len:250 (+) Transcript_6054:396-1145(+)